jgi:hypothetical protein
MKVKRTLLRVVVIKMVGGLSGFRKPDNKAFVQT